MKKLFFFFMILLLVTMACEFSFDTNKDAATTSSESQGSTTEESTGGNSSQAISSIEQVKNATVQIEAQGTFVNPDFTIAVNAAGRGSGFIIDPSGVIVTNNHVVTGAALVKVYLNGEEYNAKVLGKSECSDLAVIKIDGGSFEYLNWYDGDVNPGLEVYAAGFPLGDPEYSLSKGIIAKAKAGGDDTWASNDYSIEHDANINPGNSGGPLVTKDGAVVGINYASISSTNQSFAIPYPISKPVIDVLAGGEDEYSLGINGTAVLNEDQSLSGIWVSSVESGSPADKAGIKPGDIVYMLENLVLATDGTMKDYCDIIRAHEPGDTLSLTVIRYASGETLEGQINGRELEVTGTFDGGSMDQGTGTSDSPAAGDSPDFYSEEFDGDTSNYLYFEWHEAYNSASEDTSIVPNAEDGKMKFDIQKEDKWVYVYYDPYLYTDVQLDMTADNKGVNSNSVSLICRLSDEGWYEANIQNSGLYDILAFSDNQYFNIFNGGSVAINQGKGTNDYSLICSGDTISLYINNQLVKSVTDKKYRLGEGRVGFGVSSFNALPVKVDVENFTISQP